MSVGTYEIHIHMNLTITLLLGAASADNVKKLKMGQTMLKLTDLGNKTRKETQFFYNIHAIYMVLKIKHFKSDYLILWEPRCTRPYQCS